MASVAPLVALGAVGYWYASQPDPSKMEKEIPDEDRREHSFLQDMEHHGANASFFNQLHLKAVTMGTNLKQDTALDTRQNRLDKEKGKNMVRSIYVEHAKIASFDRSDTLLAVTTSQGTIRPQRRVAVVATLTPTIKHPDNPRQSIDFRAHKIVPNYANPAQMAAAQREWRAAVEPQYMLRNHETGEFFTRAPGQSFRYE